MLDQDEIKDRLFTGLPDAWRSSCAFTCTPKGLVKARVDAYEKQKPLFSLALQYAAEGTMLIWDTLAIHPDFQGHGYGRQVLANGFGYLFDHHPFHGAQVETWGAGSHFWALAGFSSPYVSFNKSLLGKLWEKLAPEHQEATRAALEAPEEERLWRVADLDFAAPIPQARGGKPMPMGFALLYNTRWYGNLEAGRTEAMERLQKFIARAPRPAGALPAPPHSHATFG